MSVCVHIDACPVAMSGYECVSLHATFVSVVVCLCAVQMHVYV